MPKTYWNSKTEVRFCLICGLISFEDVANQSQDTAYQHVTLAKESVLGVIFLESLGRQVKWNSAEVHGPNYGFQQSFNNACHSTDERQKRVA